MKGQKMTKIELEILQRVENKIDKLDEKFDKAMEKYIVPHEIFINNCKQEKIDQKDKKKTSTAQKLVIAIAVGNSLLAVFLAFFK
jgi:Na+-translocating ferredoxin:NAD+ oxidoreductase RnfG subunit